MARIRRIPFQFSLHILRAPEGEPEHVQCLHLERSDSTRAVAELLDRHIDPKGTMIVWSAAFDRGVNKEIGNRLSTRASLMERINGHKANRQWYWAVTQSPILRGIYDE